MFIEFILQPLELAHIISIYFFLNEPGCQLALGNQHIIRVCQIIPSCYITFIDGFSFGTIGSLFIDIILSSFNIYLLHINYFFRLFPEVDILPEFPLLFLLDSFGRLDACFFYIVEELFAFGTSL